MSEWGEEEVNRIFQEQDVEAVLELLVEKKRLDKLERFIASSRPRLQIYWSGPFMEGTRFTIQGRNGEWKGWGLRGAIDKLEDQP